MFVGTLYCCFCLLSLLDFDGTFPLNSVFSYWDIIIVELEVFCSRPSESVELSQRDHIAKDVGCRCGCWDFWKHGVKMKLPALQQKDLSSQPENRCTWKYYWFGVHTGFCPEAVEVCCWHGSSRGYGCSSRGFGRVWTQPTQLPSVPQSFQPGDQCTYEF